MFLFIPQVNKIKYGNSLYFPYFKRNNHKQTLLFEMNISIATRTENDNDHVLDFLSFLILQENNKFDDAQF